MSGREVHVRPAPDATVARRMADAAAERGDADELVAYLTDVADFLTECVGCCLVPVERGDEVLLRSTRSLGTIVSVIPQPKGADAPNDADRGSSSLPAVLPPLVAALLLVLSVAYREPVRTLVWLTPLALLLLAVAVGCVWLAGRLTARPPMTEHLRDEAAVLIERSK